VIELPKKRSQESSKSKKSRKQEEPKTCFDLKPEKTKKTEPILLGLESFKIYGYVLPYFFAHVATKYYLNKPLENLEPDDIQTILDTFCSHKKDVNELPFIVPSNDREFGEKCLTLASVCNEIRRAIKERKAGPIKVYGTILPETGEYVKLMFPKLEELRRIENLAIAPDLLALTVIGASISSIGMFGVEQHYIFVDLIQEFRVDIKSLNDWSRSLVAKLTKGNSSEIAIRVGIASLVADKAFRHLLELSRAIMYYVTIVGQLSTSERRRQIKKIMLKSFNQYDVTSLALDIAELNIANPLVELIELYPSGESQGEARKLRRIIEATCKAIYTWHATRRLGGVREGNLEELYSALRALSVLASDHEELKKLDKFVREHTEELSTLSGILVKLSERMRIPV
jgi:hypothetical protein